MKKTLIFIEKDKLANVGGPVGYNYNLKCGLDEIGANNIYYLETQAQSEIKSKFSKIKSKFIKSFLRGLRDVMNYIHLYLPFGHRSSINFNEYDAIHFHSTMDFYKYRNSIKEFKGETFITTHSPVLPSREMRIYVQKWARIIFFFVYMLDKRIDKYCFKHASYVITPCKNAMDSYKKTLKSMDKIVGDRYLYLTTGCIDYDKPVDYENERKRFFYNPGMLNVVFIGRHNKVKGYDFLVKSANISNKNNYGINYIIGGSGPIVPPTIDNWHEIGFTKEALLITKIADVYVSCNTDTYFDLATIQALSVGTLVLTRRIGGNLYFEENDVKGVFLFTDMNDFFEKLNYIKNLSVEEKNDLKEQNREFYLKELKEDIFAKRYIGLIENTKNSK